MTTPPPASTPEPAWYPPYPQYPGYGYPSYAYPPAPPTQPADDHGRQRWLRRHRAAVAGFAAAALVGAGAGAGVTAAVMSGGTGSSSVAGSSGSIAGNTGTGSSGSGGSGSSGSSGGSGSSGSSGSAGSLPQGTFPGPPGGGYSPPGYPGTSSSVSASTAQSVGVVDIDTVDGYEGAQAAGTGLVLTSTGEILTNNHVIDGATKIKVTVVSTGRTYTAKVVGDSPSTDIAVLQLVDASGLATAHLASDASLTVGETVTGVGNAGGSGGTPSAARGKVVALGRTIKASSDDGSGAETLHDMIVTNAAIVAGDSGGPLYDSANEVVGIDTAASSSQGATRGFAIPISRALRVADEIEAGHAGAGIELGYPAFLGIALAQSSGRPVIAHVYSGSPAAKAGLRAGDTITAINGTAARTYRKLHRLIAANSPGDTVSVTFTTAAGASRTVRVTLTAGPAA